MMVKEISAADPLNRNIMVLNKTLRALNMEQKSEMKKNRDKKIQP